MNVYDFDNTIYDGESTFDFYLFCVKHHPRAIKFIFVVTWNLIKYKLCLISEEKLMDLAEKYVCSFLKCCPDAEELVCDFWKSHIGKIKSFYTEFRQNDDVIVSASFGFLIRPILSKLNVKNILCSEIDFSNGKIKCLCYRKNKVNLFKENYEPEDVLDVFTDSKNDEALMSLANRDVYIVRKNKIRKLK